MPYLSNASEETVFESKKIKEQNGTMKLQNEEFMLRNTQNLDYINELSKPGSQTERVK